MGKSGKIFIGALAVSALVGTAYASWTVMGGYYETTTGEETPDIATIGTKDIKIEVTKKTAGEKLVFDEPGKEHLSLTYTVKASRGENARDDFDPYLNPNKIDQYAGLAVNYQPHLSVTTNVVDVNENFAKYVTVPSVEIHYKDWLGKGNATDGYDVTLEFAWGEATKGENPQTYVEKQYEAGNTNLDTPKKQNDFFEEVNEALKDAKFTFTFKVGGLDAAPETPTDPEDPEDPVGPTPEEPDLWTIYFQDKGWWNNSAANTNIVLYDADWNMLDANGNTIASESNWNVGIDMTYETNPGYYNGVNFFSYTIDLNKVAKVQFVRRGGEPEAYWDANTKTVDISSAKEWNLVTLSDTPAWNNEGGGWASAEVTTSFINFDDYKREEATVTINPMTNGSVKASKTSGLEGDEITLTITPENGYELDTLTWNNDSIKEKVADNKVTVTLAAGVNTVSATFEATSTGGDEPGEPGETTTVLSTSYIDGPFMYVYLNTDKIGMTEANKGSYTATVKSYDLRGPADEVLSDWTATVVDAESFTDTDLTGKSTNVKVQLTGAPVGAYHGTVVLEISNGETTYTVNIAYTGTTVTEGSGQTGEDDPETPVTGGEITFIENGSSATRIEGAGIWLWASTESVGMTAQNQANYSATATVSGVNADGAATNVAVSGDIVLSDHNYNDGYFRIYVTLSGEPAATDKTTVNVSLTDGTNTWTGSTSFTGNVWDGATTTPVETYTKISDLRAIDDAANLPADPVTIKGTVGAILYNSLIIEDATGYVQVYHSSLDETAYKIGDVYTVTGTASWYKDFSTNLQIAPADVADIVKVEETGSLSTATAVTSANFDEVTSAGLGKITIEGLGVASGRYVNFTVDGVSKEIRLTNEYNTNTVAGKMYKITGYLHYSTSSAQFLYPISVEEFYVAPKGITISATPEEIRVGGTTTLSATLSPFGATGDVTYEITKGSEYASIEGNVLTANAVGTVEVVGHVNDLTSEEAITIKISAASTDEDVSTATITSDIITHGSGYGNGSNIDVDGLIIDYFQIMKGTGDNANTLQNRCNNDNGHSAIYNTVAIKRIVSIKLNYNIVPNTNVTFELYLGNDAALSAAQSGTGNYTLNSTNSYSTTIEGDYQYFRLQRSGSNSSYISSIVIEYVAA